MILLRNFKKLDSPQIEKRFGSLYENLKPETKHALLYNVYFALRRLIFALAALYLNDYPAFQIYSLFFQSLFLLIYLGTVRPFTIKLLNYMEIFNELCILGVAYHLLLFTDFVDDPNLQYQAGWSVIGITLMNFTSNFAIIVMNSFRALKPTLIKIWNFLKRKLDIGQKKKIQKYQMNENAMSGEYSPNKMQSTATGLIQFPDPTTYQDSAFLDETQQMSPKRRVNKRRKKSTKRSMSATDNQLIDNMRATFELQEKEKEPQELKRNYHIPEIIRYVHGRENMDIKQINNKKPSELEGASWIQQYVLNKTKEINQQAAASVYSKISHEQESVIKLEDYDGQDNIKNIDDKQKSRRVSQRKKSTRKSVKAKIDIIY